MIRLISIFFVFIIFNLSQAQTNFVVYDKIINTADGNDLDRENKVLVFDQNESLFFDYGGNLDNLDNFLNDKNSVIKSSQVIRNTYKESNFQIKDNSFSEENIYALDNFQDFKWKIEKGNSKEILGFKCYKATGNYRGRIYTAWFTPDISTDIGPWKFRGLPGLILQVSDSDNFYTFQAIKISLNKLLTTKLSQKFSFKFPEQKEKFVDYKVYILKENEYISDIRAKIDAARPKGLIVVARSEDREYYIEKSFEWESEPIKP